MSTFSLTLSPPPFFFFFFFGFFFCFFSFFVFSFFLFFFFFFFFFVVVVSCLSLVTLPVVGQLALALSVPYWLALGMEFAGLPAITTAVIFRWAYPIMHALLLSWFLFYATLHMLHQVKWKNKQEERGGGDEMEEVLQAVE